MAMLHGCLINVRIFLWSRGYFSGSKFGGVLDMVTDRVSTCGILAILSHLYPEYFFVFIMLLVLDVMSHWFHVVR